MPVGEWRGISMRSELVAEIEKFIEEHPELGYKNVSQFVTEATRIRITDVKKTYPSVSPEKGE